jgi:hypothetical protein
MPLVITHPSYRGKIPKDVLGKHTQIVLTDRSELSSGREFGVMWSATGRLADLFAKHHFILKGSWLGRDASSYRALRACGGRSALLPTWLGFAPETTGGITRADMLLIDA